MKKRKLLALCLVPALLAGCCRPGGVTDLSGSSRRATAPPGGRPAADAAIGSLGAELLRAAREPGENTLLSPLSVALALSMTANGAAEDTLAEFEALLGADVEGPQWPTPPLCWLLRRPGGLHGVLHRRQPVAGRAAGSTNYSSPGVRLYGARLYAVWRPLGAAGR